MDFIGRDYELGHLDEQYERSQATFLILYGRRRVGKTHLLTHWLSSRHIKGLYWVATQTTEGRSLSSFSESVHRYITGQQPERGFTYASWEDALETLAIAIGKQPTKTVLILDEFTYAMEADSALASILQKVWDHRLQYLPVMLILSGSHVGMMERDVIAYQAPLYGRATGRLHLQPLPFKALGEFFPRYNIEERIAAYAILGGIPFYIQQFDPQKTISDNIRKRIIEGVNLLQEEPRLLLHDQIQEPHYYVAILQAIAYGNTAPAEIALDADLDRAVTNKYLNVLVNLGLLRREVPVTVRYPDQSRRGRYQINDHYLRFYFRFIHPRLSEITEGYTTAVIEYIKEQLVSFIGTYTFEELCRKWVLIAGATHQLEFVPEVVGSHWSAKEQLDVVAVNWRSHHILFGECKWSRTQPIDVEVVDKLYKRSQAVIPQDPLPFKTQYLCFGRAGFTPEAKARLAEINGKAIDLEELDRVLKLAVR